MSAAACNGVEPVVALRPPRAGVERARSARSEMRFPTLLGPKNAKKFVVARRVGEGVAPRRVGEGVAAVAVAVPQVRPRTTRRVCRRRRTRTVSVQCQ